MSSDNKVTFGSLLSVITREDADEALRDAFVSVTPYSNGSRPSDAGQYSVYIVAVALTGKLLMETTLRLPNDDVR